MSEVVETPKAETPETSSYESPSLGSVLDKVQGKESPEPEIETESPAPEKVEPESVAPEVVAEEISQLDAPIETEIEPEAVKPPPGFVPVKALQSVREQVKETREQLQQALLLNQQLQALQAPQAQYFEPQPQTEVDPNVVIKNQVVSMSERIARQAYPDYDEKYGAFAKAYNANPAKLQSLYESIMGSEHPAEAAYRAGEQILFAEKYGQDVVTSPTKFREALRKEIEAELKPKIEADTHKKIQGKLTERSKTPTDISQARSAGGSTVAEYRSPSLDQLLAKVQKRKK